ncbi:MAG: glycosyltransferase family 2 protein [Candidatus Latescibacteria bacterium]|nr:glycosyltransferase family 2 protein [Candidatus Latescibacterota bacterium]
MASTESFPVISVILPTLNAERTLERCLASIRSQDYPQSCVEIIIADAGSTDTTLDIAKHHHIEKIIPNKLKTGEAGKAAAIEASTGELLALIDSDNIFDDTGYFSRAVKILEDESIDSIEPMAWTYDPDDTLLNRYSALLGVNDPICYFLGNYNRYSHLSKKISGMKFKNEIDTPDALIIDIDPDEVPTFGANGFILRRTALDGINWHPYYFDIDVFQQMVQFGRSRIAVMKTETRHLFCDNVATFRRKQSRRINDFLYHSRQKSRTYNYRAVSIGKYIIFILSTITVVPLLWQSLRGCLNKPDSAWWFHPVACWITLWEYGWGTVRSLAGVSEYDRSTWKQ